MPRFEPKDRDHVALVTAPMRGAGLEQLRQIATVVHEPWIDQDPLRLYDAEGLAKKVTEVGADIVIVEADLVGAPLFELDITVVAATRGDANNVDLAAATAAGVPVLNTPGRNADAVAELALGLIIDVERQVLAGDRDVRSLDVFKDGTIPYQRFRGREIAGRTAALVGFGAVGQALRWRLEGLGMEVIAYDPFREDCEHDLEKVLASADIVSLHAPLNDQTRHMISTYQLEVMPKGSILLNTARSGLVDTDALVEALRSGHLAGAALDHFEGEMLPEGHPLLSMSQVVLTPHIGGATLQTEQRGAAMVANDIAALLAGNRPLNILNPEVL